MSFNLVLTHNLIGIHDGLQAMGDSDDADVLELGTYELLDQMIRLVIFHYINAWSS